MINRSFMPVGGTGGGAVDSPFDKILWQEIIKYSKKSDKSIKIGLLTTPSLLTGIINIDSLVENHKKMEEGLSCEFFLLDDSEFGSGEYINNIDILCITCGDTQGAMDRWKDNGCENAIINAYQKGVTITGYSAGFILFYEYASTDSVSGVNGATYGAMPCLGIIKGGAIPHIDTQENRIIDFQKVLSKQEISPVIALGEGVMAIYKNEKLQIVKSSNNNAIAGWVEPNNFSKIAIEIINPS